MNQLLNTFKMLSDETRLRMLVLLYHEELCVCQLGGILDIPQPRISQNLSKMKDLNLVSDERKDKYVFYSLKKNNKILMEILENIVSNIDKYPKLETDRGGLRDKETYLSQCCVSND